MILQVPQFSRVFPLTTDTIFIFIAQGLHFISNNSLNSTFIKSQQAVKGSGKLTQQDIQTPKRFVRKY